MTKDVKPLWIEMKYIDESWNTNPGIRLGKFLRIIAERIPTELKEGRVPRLHTSQDVIDWLIEQAEKGENDVRYNYPWQLTDTH